MNDLDDDDVVGMGDLGLRFFLRPKQLEWSFMEGKKNFSLMPLVEFTVPTATKDVLGGETFVVSPGVVIVFDLPFEKPPFGLALFAMMNFYDFVAWKDKRHDKWKNWTFCLTVIIIIANLIRLEGFLENAKRRNS